jgi:FAD-dependent monooxygenase
MTSGLHNDKPITSWEHPNVDDLRAQYQQKNDGSSPLEPWQRVSQAIFEKHLKERGDKNPLIDCRFGWKVEKSIESEDRVLVEAVQLSTGQKTTFSTKYLLACDGASSRVRRDMEIPIDGGPV